MQNRRKKHNRLSYCSMLTTIIEIREKKYDEKKNTVTITGPFCPHKLKKKLRCKAGCIIICIEILPPPKIDKNTQTDETPKIDKNTQTDETPKIEKKTQTDEPEPLPIRVCCKHCFEGHRVGPCHPPQCCQGLKRPPPPPPCYCNYGRPPCYCGCRGTMGYASTCKFYIEEDPAPCVIM